MSPCTSGLDRLLDEERHLVRGGSVGLICNPTAVDRRLHHAADLLHAAPDVRLARLFGPEHGVRGDAQDMIAVEPGDRDPVTGLPVVSLYGSDEASLAPPPGSLEGLDALVFDIQDVGARYYTYVYTLAACMEAASRAGIRVVVCDRPNPIGGEAVEGPLLRPHLRSFVGRFPVPVRHGCTAGELALLWRHQLGLDLDLEVVRVQGWRRGAWHDETGLSWVMPSPNMPTLDTASVYPGMCLVEGTRLSEGRGTTRPFELSGAPWIDPSRLAADLERRMGAAGAAGVRFRPVVFRPTFHKHAGQGCGGVQVHVTDRRRFEPFLTGIAFLQACRTQDPERFAWRTEPYEFVSDRLAIDLLLGDERLREMIEADTPLADVRASWAADLREWREVRAPHLLYPGGDCDGR
ncbi:DUF1343 domain-containing protein [Myxococcota bacterium]|nr:DUF1343 domain-containing protein [Myxococcota bacterium]